MTLDVQLRHRFGAFSLDLAFTAPPGVTALFGRSGAGKTTVVNAVAGLMRPDEGQISLNGQMLLNTRTGHFTPPHRRRIGYVFQEPRLFPHLSVKQNLLYGRWFARRRSPAPAADFGRVVELLGIAALLERRPMALSGGEKSRVALGRAILSAPQMLLMDEPLAALDEERKAGILPYLARLRDEFSLPILYVSHSATELAQLATTVVLIGAGRVIASGPTAEVLTAPATATGFGLSETAALIGVTVEAREADGLTRLRSAAGPLWLPGVEAGPGSALQLRILARDVMLARSRPEGISALNILPVTVIDLTGAGDEVLVRMRLGGEVLLARITPRSARALQLSPGAPLYAVVKAVSLAP